MPHLEHRSGLHVLDVAEARVERLCMNITGENFEQRRFGGLVREPCKQCASMAVATVSAQQSTRDEMTLNDAVGCRSALNRTQIDTVGSRWATMAEPEPHLLSDRDVILVASHERATLVADLANRHEVAQRPREMDTEDWLRHGPDPNRASGWGSSPWRGTRSGSGSRSRGRRQGWRRRWASVRCERHTSRDMNR